MKIQSQNFEITLGDGDMLCIGDIFYKGKYDVGSMIIDEDILIQVANFALFLAEQKFKNGNINNIKVTIN